ncbi:MAG: ATP-dependent dethiobiotin synthetase BioD [Candidatus Gastranaerophilaceae bacterium]
MLKVFISSIERQTGKTLITAGLAATMQSLSYSTNVYKPIQTGAENLNGFKRSPDLMKIKAIDPNIAVQSTYLMSGTSSPFVSSYEDNIKIDINTIFNEFISYSNLSDCSIIEGSNSISTPIAQYLTEIDIVKSLKIPLVLVVNPTKTSIDNVIANLKLIENSRVKFSGIIINQYDENSKNLEHKYFPQIIKEFSNYEILGLIPDYKDVKTLSPETLIADILNRINIEKLFGLKIAKLNG